MTVNDTASNASEDTIGTSGRDGDTLELRVPGFTDETAAAGCDCPGCAAARAAARAGRGGAPATLRGVRCAVVATVGAVALAGTGAGTAAAEPAPSHAGWDGSRYWFKSESGSWRWTSHRDVYERRAGGAKASAGGSQAARPAGKSGGGRTGEPVFRGKQGWDATDRVYWFRSGGHWYWTSHRSKYEQRTGRHGGGGDSGTAKPGNRPGGGGGNTGGTVTRGWTTPVSSYVFTGYYGQRGAWSKGYHTGQDFAVPTGTTVRAVGPGRVVHTGYNRSYGNEVVIRHADGRYTQYAHLSRIEVSAGQSVSGGQRIARSGATGRVTGPHLHFEVRTSPSFGSDVNPLAYLRGHGVRV
ncbi:M23 family metallopeptidase [Streptomyces sp. NPDC090025]|uniref:M23 family metallopeptidase n=1 Tax=Streptomyces sp. NPDC090025 TaxID=3365922 RepID=UPI003834676E